MAREPLPPSVHQLPTLDQAFIRQPMRASLPPLYPPTTQVTKSSNMSMFDRFMFRPSRVEGFQTSSDLTAFLTKYRDNYDAAKKYLKSSEFPEEVKNFNAYYGGNEGTVPVDASGLENPSSWDKPYKYYRFIFTDSTKCQTSPTDASVPSFVFEFHSMGKRLQSTIGLPRSSHSNVLDQKYANGVLLVKTDSTQFTGYSWGTGNTGGNTTAPPMNKWLLQASNDDSAWEDLTIADVFNELLQKDEARFAMLHDASKDAVTGTVFNAKTLKFFTTQLDDANRRLLVAVIKKFRDTYIQLPPALQNSLQDLYARNDDDVSIALNANTIQGRIDELYFDYLAIESGSLTTSGPTAKLPLTSKMASDIRKNLTSVINNYTDLATKCGTGAPVGSPSAVVPIATAELDSDKAKLANAQTSFVDIIDLYNKYTASINALTKNIASTSNAKKLELGGQEVIFTVPPNLINESYADQTYNAYRNYLNTKLKTFYENFMYETIEDGNTTGAPSGSGQKLRIPARYKEYYNRSFAGLYQTSRANRYIREENRTIWIYGTLWVPMKPVLHV